MSAGRPAPRPLGEASFRRVRAVLSDVDGTLTTGGRIEGQTVRALEALRRAGLGVVLVSGRSAGFGECWARELPVDGVVVENGGLWFFWKGGALQRRYAQPARLRARNRRRLEREVARVLRRVKGAELSWDSAYAQVDLAIDCGERAQLGPEAVRRIEAMLRLRGVRAVRSSVHVNCWIGRFNKLTAARRLLGQLWGASLERPDARWVYAGDSFNDAPMFRAFSLSVGVANVRAVLGEIESAPAFITRAAEGGGFRELARAILGQKTGWASPP